VTWSLFGSSRKVTFIETGDKDKVTSKLELLTDKMRSQHNRFNMLFYYYYYYYYYFTVFFLTNVSFFLT